MKGILLSLPLLAGCATHTAPPAITAAATIPEADRSCPAALPVPPPPRPPRTIESIVAWTVLLDRSRASNAWALKVCNDRRQELLEILEAAPG